MSQWRMDVALGALALSLATLAARRARNTAIVGFAPIPVVSRAPAHPVRETADSLDSVADTIVENDPFRLSNHASNVEFDRNGDAFGARTSPPPVAVAPRPTLALRGISGGPPWQAVIDGIPGQGTVVASAGSSFDKIVVRAVTRDSVIVQGADTTWILRMPLGQP